MFSVPNLLMIGGNSRNCGKTTLACNLIRKFAVNHKVIGLKVSNIRPGDTDMHGNHRDEPAGDFFIMEEFDRETNKDTSKLLRAGAARVFYIRATDDCLKEAILDFLNKYTDNQPIVCESRSLRDVLEPGLFFMMIRTPESKVSKDVSDYLLKADKVFFFNDQQVEKEKHIENIAFLEGKFILRK